MDTQSILFQQDGNVASITLNRPAQFNALNEATLDALRAQFMQIAHNQEIRVVVLQATGKAFCAGHDLREMRAQPSQAYYQQLFKQCSKMMMALRRLPQPVIAKVQGIATASGCQLVAMCDLALASEDASFAVSGVNLGLFCSTPSVALSRNIPTKQAFEMLVTGGFISAREAKERGLINRVVPHDELDKEVAALARMISAKSRAAIAAGKGLFYAQQELGIEAAYELAAHTMACNMMDAGALDGVQAFLEKKVKQ